MHRLKTVHEAILYRDLKEEEGLKLPGVKEEGILNTWVHFLQEHGHIYTLSSSGTGLLPFKFKSEAEI